jgi:hypothetical protein
MKNYLHEISKNVKYKKNSHVLKKNKNAAQHLSHKKGKKTKLKNKKCRTTHMPPF